MPSRRGFPHERLARARRLKRARLADTLNQLWSFPLEGTPAPNAGEELVPKSAFDPNGDVDAMQVGVDGAILYRGDQTTDTETALYAITTFVFWDDFEGGDFSAW